MAELIKEKDQAIQQAEEAEERMAELIKENYRLKNACYISRKADKVDQALGKFINEYPEKEKMKIMFLRESEGVYQFGQKRVYVKVEHGNQILVRVGGGFMHIREFIDQFTDSEAAKFEQKNVIDRF